MAEENTPRRRQTDDCVDIVSFVQLKQTLVVLASVFSIVMVIVPIILTRMFDKIDDLNEMRTEVAVLGEKVTNLRGDIDTLTKFIEMNNKPTKEEN